MNNENTTFPRHEINPKKKDKAWILQACKAIWNDFDKSMPAGSIFYSKRDRYNEIRDYALNKQSTKKYLKWQTGEETPDTAFFNIDQSTDAIVKTHRQKALGKLKKISYNITATAIDPLAKGKLNDYYNDKKVVFMMRELVGQDGALAAHPMLAKQVGEPDDIEELEMEMMYNPKFIRSKEAEQSVQMIYYENDFDSIVDQIDEDLFDFGVGVIKEGIDDQNRVYIRKVNPGNFKCSYSEDGNFKSLTRAGEAHHVLLSELAKKFDMEDMEKIAQLCKGQLGNPNAYAINGTNARGYDDFKALVFDVEFISYDTVAYQERKNKAGNIMFGKADPSALEKGGKTYTGEGEKDKYFGKTIENVYKGKWIVGSDFIYDYGAAANQKRSIDKKKMGKTNLSYHVVAASFDRMNAKGITEDLIPIADEIQMTVLKLRNLNNRMIINGLSIDFTALEGVALGGAGEKALTPEENLEMMFQIGIIGVRSDLISQDGKNQRKAVEPLILDYANQFTALWNNYQNNVNKLYEISGLNQATDSATVNPKMLVGVQNNMNASTSNALYFIENARRKLVEKTARNIIPRLQTAVMIAPYEGYVQTLGKNTIDFLKFEESTLPFDYDIIVEDRPTEEQKGLVIQSLQQDIANGLLDTVDAIEILNTYNLKQSQIILGYKTRKARERIQKEGMQQQQMNAQVQMQSSQAAEQAKQQTLAIQSQLKIQEINVTKEWDYKIEALRQKGGFDKGEMAAASGLIKAGMVEAGKQQPSIEMAP